MRAAVAEEDEVGENPAAVEEELDEEPQQKEAATNLRSFQLSH